jgi:hypothetical protein
MPAFLNPPKPKTFLIHVKTKVKIKIFRTRELGREEEDN